MLVYDKHRGALVHNFYYTGAERSGYHTNQDFLIIQAPREVFFCFSKNQEAKLLRFHFAKS